MDIDNSDIIRQIAVVLCKADGVDPYKTGVGIGNMFPVGKEYQLWEARIKQATAVFENFIDC